jgi:CubicO group peptidase (beta-lactamase class C family)
MIKNFIFGVIAIIILGVMTVGFLIWFQIETKPQKVLKVKSIAHKKTSKDSKDNAGKWISSLYNNAQIPSVSAAISINGDLMWAGATGYADLNNNILADTDSIYRIGSVSKSITATALMRLHDQEIININSSFFSYVKDFPAKSYEFTIKQLASHQAGIRHYLEGVDALFENYSNVEYASTREAAAIVEGDDLLFPPGSDFNYSTYGYTLLSLAMERASEQEFEEIIKKQVLSPARMASTFLEGSFINNKKITVPYMAADSLLLRSPEINLSSKYAGGGFISTPSDLVKLGNDLLGNGFLSVQSKDAMWSPSALDNGNVNSQNYGLGFRVDLDSRGKYVHHGGTSLGGFTYLVIYPDHNTVVAFATNVTPDGFVFDRQKEAEKLINIFSPEI